jgi:hypothetical protein
VCASEVPADLPFERAASVTRAIENAIDSLGDGPYGRATAALFGTRPSSRGLLLPQRRREAAAELGIEAATLTRHREPEMIMDLAVGIYLHDPLTPGDEHLSASNREDAE